MESIEAIEAIFRQHKIPYFGICHGRSLLPFFQNGATRRLNMEVTSVIACLFPYKPRVLPKVQNVALYAIYPDYHGVIGKRLEEICGVLRETYPHYQFKGYVDVSPIDEIKAASLCGLGNIGESGLLIHREYGAIHFIGSILTDMPLPLVVRQGLAGCVHCGKCKAVCPTGALIGEFDQKKCLSAITQKKGQLTEEEEGLIRQQGYVWGCDCCTMACPIGVEGVDFSLDQISVVTEENLDTLLTTRAFAWRGRKVLERNIQIVGGRDGT